MAAHAARGVTEVVMQRLNGGEIGLRKDDHALESPSNATGYWTRN